MENFLAFIANIFDVPPNEITMETSYQSIPQWNSLMHLRLVAEIEENYAIEIPIDKVPGIKTLGEFYRYILSEDNLCV